MKIRFQLGDDLPLDKVLSIPMCIIVVKSFFKKTTTIIYRFIYMTFCMNLNINMSVRINFYEAKYVSVT